jgi:type II secretory pathway component PulF
MALGLRSDVSILKVLETEARQGSARHREVMSTVLQMTRQGESLAKAFEAVAPYFPRLLIQMVAAGETSGGIDRILEFMSRYYQELRLARRQFLAQITWPLIQLGLAIAVLCLMIALRGFLSRGPAEYQYDSLGLGLSGGRGVAIFLSWILVAVLLIGGAMIAIGKNWMNCHRYLIPLVLPIPVIGSVFSNAAMARMSMTLSMLLNAGVDALRSVRESFLSTGNDYYIQGMDIALQNVQRGQSLATSLSEAKVFPEEFIHGVEVGELSGNETESLEYLAAEYGRRAKTSLTQLSVLVSTGIWIMIAAMIIFFIIRMTMQYVNMLNSLM